ncbi:NucA/NucB deoxyribonuclease domain-containing protein [Streptomyces ortus]|uniref:Deoxyribonuclease NucA/NucB domain-containing protein n=1 Tax=Streptomyces ortus TaxID=2867268 RepID=A0ABT3UWA4_9ACTN|nr:hypothetical protein [Streptomyces ortus]MCX4231816.1 hypothetical protein [Streptomyces ortus]
MRKPSRPALLMAALLAVTATGTTGAGISQATPAATTIATPAATTAATTSAETLTQSAAFTADTTCTTIPTENRTDAGGAVKACTRVQPVSAEKSGATSRQPAAPSPPAAGITAAAADDPSGDGTTSEFEPDADDPEPPEPSCAVANEGQWTWSRTGGMCLRGVIVKYTLYNAQSVPIGTGDIEVNSTLATSYKTLDLKETITAKLINVSGDVKSLTVRMKVSCGAGCKTVTQQPWFATTLVPQQQVSGSTKYSGDSFATDTTRSSFRTSYAMYVTMPGATPIDENASWSSPADGEIRCDKEQPRLRGCVIPTDDLPVLSYSRSHEKYGIVVPIYEEIMQRRGTNILHAVDQDQANTNRAATCTPFTNIHPNTSGADSCDEFPMASTKEGGQDGSLCAELTPQVVNNVWSAPATWPDRPTTGTETCLRLHISQRANSSAGGVLGSLRKYQRLVNNDPFRIEFTA